MVDPGSDARRAAEVWLAHVPKPPPRPTGIDWDVFISYRSLDRKWALVLYDTLREAGYDIFLDQYVLQAGVTLDATLEKHLSRSASAVLVWSRAAADSDWVRAEYSKIRNLKAKAERNERPPFHYVIAKLDTEDLPFLDGDKLFVPFHEYPDGPRGGELLRLIFGLVGRGLSTEAVKIIGALDEETRDVLNKARVARDLGHADALLELANLISPALFATPQPLSVIIDALISIADIKNSPERLDQALELLTIARERFPRSIRPRQLTGLAYRRKKQVREALEVLKSLHVAGHRDPETMGMLGASFMEEFRVSGRKIDLERSQDAYADAFTKTPSDSYVGINAASKLAMLGRVEEARVLAETGVLPLVANATSGDDYWMTVTLAEVELLRGHYPEAAKLYRQAVVRHPAELGSIASSREQVLSLFGPLKVPDADQTAIVAALTVE
jgi:tetratricopeptide (TPR) repeat protein